MKERFDCYKALTEKGFTLKDDEYGLGRTILTIHFSKEVEVLWHGKMESNFTVDVVFNGDLTTLTAYYYKNSCRPDKVKTHLNEKRAYNAIIQTIDNAGFTFKEVA